MTSSASRGNTCKSAIAMLLKDCTCTRLPCVKGGSTELAVTEGFSVDVWQKLPQSYGQLPQEGAQEVSNSLMLQHCANFGGRTQFAPTVIIPHLQLFHGTSRTPSPTMCADKLHLLKPPSDEGADLTASRQQYRRRLAPALKKFKRGNSSSVQALLLFPLYMDT